MAVHFDKDAHGIVTLTLDLPDRSANVINETLIQALQSAIDKVEADENLKGVIIASAKRLWLAGADIDTMFAATDPAHHFNGSQELKAIFRRLETLDKPVVAALTGTALGGGMELALACHYRIALDDPKIMFGFPEVSLGLMPGAGGVARTVRLIGLEKAFEWLIQNKKYNPQQALEAGMIHAIATNLDNLKAQAVAWIKANPAPQAPWDAVKQYRIPGGDPRQPKIAHMLAVAPAYVRQETKGNFPAPHAIMAAAVEGALVDFTTACRIESRYFTKLASGQVSKNMINAFWFNLNDIKKGASRPRSVPPQDTTKVGVLGAGMMGHGIAYVTAYAGMDVVMTDASQERADMGKEKIAGIMHERVSQGRMSQADMEEILGRVVATADYDQLDGCDLIIEAVFEERDLKAQVTKMAETAMKTNGVFASNTSTLPITSLAVASQRPDQFIGLHFFSPVHKMQLVEIIVGEKTSDETLAKAFDYVLKINKVPIVVNDSRGFYTSRVFGTWVNEGVAMLGEGQHPQAIEMAGIQAGMPVGPLALIDEVSLHLVSHINKQTNADLAAEGKIQEPHPAMLIINKMLDLGRGGRSEGAGFYEYNGSKHLWEDLCDVFPLSNELLDQKEMIDRFLFIQSLETMRCLEEGVLRSVPDANIGSILGWGYAPFHGGTLQFVNAYGLTAFLERAQSLADSYGERFSPPQLLIDMAANEQIFA